MFSLFGIIAQGIKGIIKSPAVLFIYGILAKWYIMVMMATIMVTYWVFQGLESSGVLSSAYNVVSKGLEDSKAIAQHCTPKIKNLGEVWTCVKNPPKYKDTEADKDLKKNVDALNDNVKKYFNEDNGENPYGEGQPNEVPE